MSSRMRSKPPLPKSPLRLRSRQVLLSTNSSTLQTPPGLTKFNNVAADLESNLPMDYSSISSEIHALAKMVEKEFAQEEEKKVVQLKSRAAAASASASSLEHMAANSEVFERGRFYDEYSARRNERLRRKKGGGGGEGTPYNLGVEPMTTKRRGTAKKKATTVVSMAETTAPRYSLRSMKKPPPLPLNVDVSAMKSFTATTRRVRRI
ncbi:hypothetical protein N665_4037s0004 [Sinapis alba]|nr:hypothetical protein N665_4037s0004 [Sinapis alba]